MPPLTPFLGPWLTYSAGWSRSSRRHTFENKVMGRLIERLPWAAHLKINCHYRVHNWLPFYWRGFQQTTRYSYIMDLSRGVEALRARLRKSLRAEMRKAESRYALRYSEDIAAFFRLNAAVFAAKKKRVPYTEHWLEGLDAAARARACRAIYLAEEAGEPHAGAYVVWDERSAYLLAAGRSPHAGPGAVSLLIWRAIEEQVAMGRPCFDFEGSMIPGVEYYFRGFGAELTPYFRLTRPGWR
jgi:hypothetical protein